MTTVTEKIQDLLPGVTYLVNQAARRADILIYAIHLDADNGISVFTGSAGNREHLANLFALPRTVHEIPVGGALYRKGVVSGVTIRIHGRDVS